MQENLIGLTFHVSTEERPAVF